MIIALGVALIVVDTTIVNVIIPSIVRDLSVDSTQTQWIQESYAIIFAALLLLVGRVSDIFGARRIFVVGVVVFGASSLLAALAPSGGLLIGARFLQGIGGAVVLPTSLALLNTMFTGKARGKAFAVWGSTIGAASALGPLLGGWLAEHLSWRWAFGVNIPLSVVILAGAAVFLDRSPRRRGGLDVVGATLSVTGLGLLAFGLIEGRTYGWVITTAPLCLRGLSWTATTSPVFVALIVAVGALAGFAVRQAALTRNDDPVTEPLMNLRLFAIPSFRGGNVATLIIGIGEFGIIAVLPLWLQFTVGYTAVQAGLALLPVAVGSVVASGASFSVAAAASPLALVRVGLGLEALGLAALGALASTDTPWWHIALVLFVYGTGVGFATAQVTNVVLDDIPDEVSGQGSGIQSTFRQLGSALGIAILTTVFFSILGAALYDNLTSSGTPAGQADRFSRAVTASAGAAIRPLSDQPATALVGRAAKDAMTQGLSLASYVAAGFLVIGLVATGWISTRPTTHTAATLVTQRAEATTSAISLRGGTEEPQYAVEGGESERSGTC
ncbi:DHA2 family efflux MFS transporter permease subunit [Mycobacterium sp.]|uniref:DHA2 family efflux MFS transporter permease subunit n=1 Tax=Mycobacterium sp. TaxID=1785 RepID=UPI003D136F30